MSEINADPAETRQEHLAAARSLAEEIMPRLENEFPLAYQNLQEMLDNGFTDGEIKLDAGEMLSRIQNVMDQRDVLDQAKLAQTMESIAQGKDPETGENLMAHGTGQ